MASNAFTAYLQPLLRDAVHLLLASHQLPTGIPGRPLRIAALNRAIVVTCASAWEAFIEDLVRESRSARLRPPIPPSGRMARIECHRARTVGQVQQPKHREHSPVDLRRGWVARRANVLDLAELHVGPGREAFGGCHDSPPSDCPRRQSAPGCRHLLRQQATGVLYQVRAIARIALSAIISRMFWASPIPGRREP